MFLAYFAMSSLFYVFSSCGAQVHSYWAVSKAELFLEEVMSYRKMKLLFMFLSLEISPFFLSEVSLTWFDCHVHSKPGEYITHFFLKIWKLKWVKCPGEEVFRVIFMQNSWAWRQWYRIKTGLIGFSSVYQTEWTCLWLCSKYLS